jgi:tetratricopeptide (TPR) repeat protein
MRDTLKEKYEAGVEAHKVGNFVEAERWYREVLAIEPLHPAANHHLGTVAVSLGQPGNAIPHFRVALEAEPEIEQCWVSFIDALILDDQIEAACKALSVGKNTGVIIEALASLEARLAGEP